MEVMASEEEKARGVEVVATHRRAERRAEVSERFGIRALASNREACEGADMIIPLVRPEQMAALMEEVGPVIREESDRGDWCSVDSPSRGTGNSSSLLAPWHGCLPRSSWGVEKAILL